MKRFIFVMVLVMSALLASVSAQGPARGQGGARPNIFAPAATANGPIADVMNGVVKAFNSRDTAFFEKLISPDAVWLDEDGHHLIATVWMNRLLSANPPRKLSITNLRTESWGDGGWAGFNYVLEATNQVKGVNSMVFKKTGDEWKIVLIHGAVDTAIVQH
jgi:ketosteroid isomerase-like protein